MTFGESRALTRVFLNSKTFHCPLEALNQTHLCNVNTKQIGRNQKVFNKIKSVLSSITLYLAQKIYHFEH